MIEATQAIIDQLKTSNEKYKVDLEDSEESRV